jgi:hypothetical protein
MSSLTVSRDGGIVPARGSKVGNLHLDNHRYLNVSAPLEACSTHLLVKYKGLKSRISGQQACDSSVHRISKYRKEFSLMTAR